ncbi:MAG: gliding motility-associated C-terminal domain-containing protein [Chitinophagaceae bacterium]|nr:gliding motility-associated C-terminal domain-containing protein [Chitinophagaceae bacterium]
MTGLLMAFGYSYASSQVCPPNIDFENGSFDGWTCYTGYVTGNGQNVISLTPSGIPVPGQHTMYSSFPGDGVDPYGGFPVNCPNGSGHSIKLGNNFGGGQAEGISYEFTIPANTDYYTLIYNYAVVFQDPSHEEYQQPRMEIEVLNVTDNTRIFCSSFTFVPYGSILPGFFESPDPGGDTPVWCKDWTAVSINLDGHAGKTIRIFFKTADCTFQRHFGYAYIDVNSECSGTFTGATFCPDDTLVNVVAPFGYQSYAWFNNTFTQVLGYQQVLTLQPPPPAGTTIAVQLIPYSGYGCLDTLYARLVDTLTVTANAGSDALSCNHDPVPIGTPPKPGLVYSWSPATGLSNPSSANPRASPDTTTTYILTVNHDGGGCFDTDTVVVVAAVLNKTLEFLGKEMYCTGSGDSAVLRVQPTDNIQWYRDGVPVPGATLPVYRVTQSGTYHASLTNNIGCSMITDPKQVIVTSVPVPGINAGTMNQCLVGNRFLFTNTSTNAVGTMEYQWVLGDGTMTTSKDVTHSYVAAGIYNVKLIVSSSPVCFDSISALVTVYQNAIADFDINPVCINLPMQAINKTVDTLGSTIHYLWDFNNGQTSSLHTPPPQVYTSAGNFQVSLSVNTEQCPSPLHVLKKIVVVDKPRSAVRYPVQFAVVDFPLGLQARQFGETALWSPGTFLNTQESYTPVFNGSSEQLYTIKITTASGCVTVDTQVVKTVKEAAIYVPTAFSPNNDGLNDRLRPVLMGIKEIRYFRIFNRWGQLLYHSKTELPGWDGTINGIPQATQVFVWMIEGISIDNRVISRKGTATLVR